MYKFLVVFILLFVILLLALNMGVLKTTIMPDIKEALDGDGVSKIVSDKTVKSIQFGIGPAFRITAIQFNYTDETSVCHGNKKTLRTTLLTLDHKNSEYINLIEVYRAHDWGPYRGTAYCFLTNKGRRLDAIEPKYIAPSTLAVKENKDEKYKTLKDKFYTLPFDGIEKYAEPLASPIIDILWRQIDRYTFGGDKRHDYMLLGMEANSKAGTKETNNSAEHAFPYGITVGLLPPTYEESTTDLIKIAGQDLDFNFNLVVDSQNNNSRVIVQTMMNYFGIGLDKVIKNYDMHDANKLERLRENYVYQKFSDKVKELKDIGIRDFNHMIQLLSEVRTTKTTDAFTGLREGNTEYQKSQFLTDDGQNLTDLGAHCYLNGDSETNKTANKEVIGAYLLSTVGPKGGLKFRIFNSYFGLNNNNNNSNVSWISNNPWGTSNDGKTEYDSYKNKLYPLSSANKCSFDKNLLVNNPPSNFISTRDHLNPCIIAEGIAMTTWNISEATTDWKDPAKPSSFMLNNNISEYYTVEWKGFFKPDVTGTWEFYIASDDGAHVFIYNDNSRIPEYNNGSRVCGAAGLHGMQGSYGTKNLEKGKYYNILVLFGENWGGDQVVFAFKCAVSPAASNWTANGTNFFFTDIGGTNSTPDQQIQDNYEYNQLNSAKTHWKNAGKPNAYTCDPKKFPDISVANVLNYYNSTGGSNESYQETMETISNHVYTQYAPQGISNPNVLNNIKASVSKTLELNRTNGVYSSIGKILPPVEQFGTIREGLQIKESELVTYATELKKFGVTDVNDMARILKDLTTNFGMDLSTPENISTLFSNYTNFGITTYDDLNNFSVFMSSRYRGFLPQSDYVKFVALMVSYGYKFNTDAFRKFMETLDIYDITSYDLLLVFNKKMEEDANIKGDPMSTIALLRSYGVEDYSTAMSMDSTSGFLGQLVNYCGDELKTTGGRMYVEALVGFKVDIRNFNSFIGMSDSVQPNELFVFIKAMKAFGISGYRIKNSTQTYSDLLNILKNNTDFPTDFSKLSNYVLTNVINIWKIPDPTTATSISVPMRNVHKMIQYAAMGVETYTRLMEMRGLSSKIGINDPFNISSLIYDDTLLKFFNITNKNDRNTYSQYAKRFVSSINIMTSLGYTKTCNYFQFLRELKTNITDISIDNMNTYLSSNKSTYGATYANYLNCNGSTSAFTTIREGNAAMFTNTPAGPDRTNIMSTTTDFGITKFGEARFNNGNWDNIPDLNAVMTGFNVNTSQKYKLFMGSLSDFGINKTNFKEYTDLLLSFGVRVDNIVNFTQLIKRVGVDYNGFRNFITAIMMMGVYVDDFVPFLCYLYSFGIVYDKSGTNSDKACDFFAFLSKMRSYGLTYTDAENGGKKFMNAIDNFVYILTYGYEKVNCSSERLLASMSQENMGKTTDIIDKGKQTTTTKYCKYFMPFPYNGTQPIMYSLTEIMDKVKTLDPNLRDFANLNRYAAMGVTGFNSDADTVEVNGSVVFTLNLMDPNTKKPPNYSLLKTSFQKYTGIFMNSNLDLNDRVLPPLDVRNMTTFMTDNDNLNEFKNLLVRSSLPITVLDTVVERMISYNISNNGKKDTQNAYNGLNTTINTTKLFPYFSIAYIRNYIAYSPDMIIPADDKENADKNPLNIRCEPYNKAGYSIQKCSDTFATMNYGAPFQYGQVATSSQIWQSPLSSSSRPVQTAGKSPSGNLTILNPSTYTTANSVKNYSSANW